MQVSHRDLPCGRKLELARILTLTQFENIVFFFAFYIHS